MIEYAVVSPSVIAEGRCPSVLLTVGLSGDCDHVRFERSRLIAEGPRMEPAKEEGQSMTRQRIAWLHECAHTRADLAIVLAWLGRAVGGI